MPVPPTLYISHGYCPGCGYDLTGVPCDDDEQVTCPECGTPNDHRLIPVAPPPGPLKKFVSFPKEAVGKSTWVLGLVFSFVVAVIVFLPSISQANSNGRWMRDAMQLLEIHQSMFTYTGASGSYPAHVALLVPGEYVDPSIFESPLGDGGVTTVGEFDLADYDWSEEATEALEAAVESMDTTAPYYQFGDYWFVRPPNPMANPRPANTPQVVCWSGPLPGGVYHVVFDDNHVERVEAGAWVWKKDAAAPKKIGLPVIPPAFMGRGRR